MTARRSIHLLATVALAAILAGCDHSWDYDYFVVNNSDCAITIEYWPVNDRRLAGPEVVGKSQRATMAPHSEGLFYHAHQVIGSPVDEHKFRMRILCDTTVVYEQQTLTRSVWNIEHGNPRFLWGGFWSRYTITVFEADDPRRAHYGR